MMTKHRLAVSGLLMVTLAAVFMLAANRRVESQVVNCPTPDTVAIQRIPYNRAARLLFNQSGEDFLTTSLLTVPADKVLTVEHVSGVFSSDSTQTYYVTFSDADTFQGFAWFTVTTGAFQGNQVAQRRTLNQPIKLDFTGGQQIILAVQRSKPVGFTDATVMVSGYLSDAPCSPVIGR